MIVKPNITPEYIWANSKTIGEDIITPLWKCRYRGWTYEDKPAYQEWNWYYFMSTQFLNHFFEQSVPTYSKWPKYPATAMVKYSGIIYYSNSLNENEMPAQNSRYWNSIEYVNGISDIYADILENNQLLVYYEGGWNNMFVQNYPLNVNFNLENFKDYQQPKDKSAKDDSGSYLGSIFKKYNSFVFYGDKFTSKTLNDLIKEYNVTVSPDVIFKGLESSTSITFKDLKLKRNINVKNSSNKQGVKMYTENGDLIIKL